MKISLIFLFVILAISASFLFRKYGSNTRQGIIIRGCWFLAMISIFFAFLSNNFNLAQNLAVGFFGGAGLVYLFAKMRSIKRNSGQ